MTKEHRTAPDIQAAPPEGISDGQFLAWEAGWRSLRDRIEMGELSDDSVERYGNLEAAILESPSHSLLAARVKLTVVIDSAAETLDGDQLRALQEAVYAITQAIPQLDSCELAGNDRRRSK